MITTPEQFGAWQLEHSMAERLLARIEQVERGELAALGLPTEPVALYGIVSGESSTSRTADVLERASHGMHALAWIAKARRHMQFGGNENARLAAHAAMLAALVASASAARAALKAEQQRNLSVVEAAVSETAKVERRRLPLAGGLARGAKISEKAAIRDPEIRRHYSRWMISEEGLQDEHPSLVGYISKTTGIASKTVERRLKVMNLAK